METVKTMYGYYTEIPGRKVVRTYASGKFTAEHVITLTNDILKVGKKYTGKWGYIADPTGIDPIIPKEAGAEFVKLHGIIEAAGCKAIAFLDGNTAAMKLQSQKHQDKSDAAGLQVGHFKTEKDALDWLETMGI